MHKKYIDRFNKKAQQWLDFIEEIDGTIVIKRPTKNSWSLSELYDHVIKVAKTYQLPNTIKATTEER